MKRFIFTIVAFVGLLNSQAQETVFLTDGKFQKGNILSTTKKGITFEFEKSGSKKKIDIKWDSINKIEFTPSKQLLKAVNNSDEVPLEAVAKIWDQQVDYLSRPLSRTAQVGLVYANKLAESTEDLSDEAALDLYEEIADQAWSPYHQGQAIRGKLKLLIKTGREREALRQAEELALESENPEHLLEAKYVLAESAFAELKELEQEHPRWNLDDEVRPKRERIYDQAIDQSLFAFLFYGTQESAVTRGLMHAAKVYEFGKDYESSEVCANDILRLYPQSELAAEAKKQLANLSKLKKK